MSIRLKAEFIVEYDLRGAIIWEITGDYLETSPESGVIEGTPLVSQLNKTFCNYTSSLSIESMTITESLLYPNPGTNNIFINNNETKEVSFISISGQNILNRIVSTGEAIDISQLPNGLYMVHIKSSITGEKTILKFIKH